MGRGEGKKRGWTTSVFVSLNYSIIAILNKQPKLPSSSVVMPKIIAMKILRFHFQEFKMEKKKSSFVY